MKKTIFVSLLCIMFFGLSAIANASDKAQLKKYFLTETLQAVKVLETIILDTKIAGKHREVTVMYNDKNLGTFPYEMVGNQGTPIFKTYSVDWTTIIVLTYDIENESRANLISQDVVWISDWFAQTVTQIDLPGKIAGEIKETEKQHISFLSFDHPQSDQISLLKCGVYDPQNPSVSKYNMATFLSVLEEVR